MSDSPDATPRYLPLVREQRMLVPLDVERLIGDDHPARRIWRFVEGLDLSHFEADARAVEGRAGRRAHSPHLLVAVWIYAYTRRLHSAREIARQMEYEPGFEWLTAMRPVNHHTLSDFRVAHGEALRDLFIQILALLTKNGLITLERVATDGTKIRADVNRKSFRRKKKLEQHLKAAPRYIKELEEEAADEQVTRRQQTAQRRAARETEQRIDNALAEIEQLQAANKKKEPQTSSTDPAARFMRTGDGGLAPSYNVQVTADAENGLIADIDAVSEPQDAAQLAPAMERIREQLGRFPQQVLADSGYTNHEAIVAMAERDIDFYGVMVGRSEAGRGARGGCAEEYRIDNFTYDEVANEMICPQGKRLRFVSEHELRGGRLLRQWVARSEDCNNCPIRQLCCPRLQIGKRGRSIGLQQFHPAVQAFDRKMATAEAQAIYIERAPLVEFANAWIKTKLGLRRFATRGLDKVRCEVLWAAITHNLQRVFALAPELA